MLLVGEEAARVINDQWGAVRAREKMGTLAPKKRVVSHCARRISKWER
jgi:hypothetical protein